MIQSSNFEVIKKSMADAGNELSDLQINQLIDYYDLLIEWNSFMNLTAITEFNDVVMKHFVDSLAPLTDKAFKFKKDSSIIDVGTGAGFPGIPLKIACPEIKLTLCDALNKRVGFLNAVIEKCNLDNTIAVHLRAEEGGRDRMYREKFDYSVARAVAKLPTLCEYTIPFVKPDGFFIAYKTLNQEDLPEASEKAALKLGCVFERQYQYSLKESDSNRVLYYYHKKNKTPIAYPRLGGKPSSAPLQ